MNLDEAIEHCYGVADRLKCVEVNKECGADHKQLGEWLEELKQYREKDESQEAVPHISQKQASLIAQHTLWWLDEAIMCLSAIREIAREHIRKPYKLYTLYEIMEICRLIDKVSAMLYDTLYTQKDEYGNVLDNSTYKWLISYEKITTEVDIKQIKTIIDYVSTIKLAMKCQSSISAEFHEYVCFTLRGIADVYFMLDNIRKDFIKNSKYLSADLKAELEDTDDN